TENELKEVWMEQKMMNEWRRAEVPLRNLRNFELIFEVVRARDVTGGAALDDLQFIDCARSGTYPGSCPAATDFVCSNGDCVVSSLVCDNKPDCTDGSDELDCSSLAGACNFNMPEDQWQAACQLVQDQDDDFDWQLGHGRKYQGTGPSTDHSADGAGGYLYANSTLQREADVARIITQQEFPASFGVCHLRFWFHMYSSKQMGTLKVFTVANGGIPLLMWAASRNYGNVWRYSNVVLSNPHPFRVSFQAEVGKNKWTTIAIDDLSFTQECAIGAPVTPVPPTCDSGNFQCLYLMACVPQSWRCDGEADCVDGSDEEDCGSLVPGTVPPQTSCEDSQYSCAKNMCIPTLLRCDSIPDCPNGEDEYGCPVVQCKIGELVCEGNGSCIPHSKRCDHTIDCPAFNSDESSCNECPSGYCLNNGVCIVGNRGPVCICKSTWTGNRCHVQQKPTPPTSSIVIADTKTVTLYIAISVAVFLILAVVLGAGILYFVKRKCTDKDSRLIANDELDNYATECRGQLPDVRSRASTGFRVKWSKFHKLAISVYPWRDEPQ
ncbi:MAM and LDL-receptor class A domain-containing protein 1, partial [Clarias magur]